MLSRVELKWVADSEGTMALQYREKFAYPHGWGEWVTVPVFTQSRDEVSSASRRSGFVRQSQPAECVIQDWKW